MGTPLYNTDVIPLTSRPTLTVMDDGDYFVILDTSTGKISKILKTNAQKALNISYDNTTSGLTATQVQAALDELVVDLGSADDAITALKGVGYTDGTLKSHEDRIDTLEGADTVEGSVAKSIKDNAENATFTPTVASGIESETLEEAVNEVGEKKVSNENLFDYVVGKNIFNINSIKIFEDIVPENDLIYSSSRGVTGVIPCKPNTQYTISRQTITTRFRVAYTQTDELAANVPITNYTSGDTLSSITLPADEDAKFIVCYLWRVADQGEFSLDGLDALQIQVEEGDTETTYEKYGGAQGNIKKSLLVSTEVKGKIISILGDSISTFDGYIPTANRPRYPTTYLTDVDDTYWKKLIDFAGLTLGVNESWAGSRVSWDGTTESADIGADKHMASTTRINNLGGNGTPDIILFFGGTNDIAANVTLGTFDGSDLTTQAVDTFSDAYSTALIRLQTAYPNAKIFVLTPLYVASYYNNVELAEYVDQIKIICDFFGVNFVDLRKCMITIFNDDINLGDGIHPNISGMDLIFKYLVDTIIKMFD